MDTPPADFDRTLMQALAPWGLELTPAQIEKLRTHYTMMIETNRVMNLTRITDPIEAATKHYADSLALVACVAERGLAVRTVLDIGTGAGFPAIPLAVARPDWSITAIDGTRKKIDFVRRAGEAIGLSNLHCEHANSSHWETQKTFDLVTLRAVANPVEVARGFVAQDGYIIHYSRKMHEVDVTKQVKNKQPSAADTFPYGLPLGTETLDRQLRLIGPRAKARG